MRDLRHVRTSYKEDTTQLDFYGTVNKDNTPHITLLTSMHLYGDDTFVWGQYSSGLSKENQQQRNKVGFLSVINGKQAFFGKANWLMAKDSGEELDLLNRIPQFRYNNVYGYKPVHMLNVKELSDEQPLDTAELQKSRKKTQAQVASLEQGEPSAAVSHVTADFFARENRTATLGFIDSAGYPVLVPLDHAVLLADGRVIFQLTPYWELFRQIEEGAPIAIHVLAYDDMGTVLVEGRMKRSSIDGEEVGMLTIERVYNPMLPVIGYVYPPSLADYTKVEEFENTLHEFNV